MTTCLTVRHRHWWLIALALAWLVGSVVWAQDWRSEENARRIATLEAVRSDARLAVLEDRAERVDKILYGIAVAVGASLVLQGLSFSRIQQRGAP